MFPSFSPVFDLFTFDFNTEKLNVYIVLCISVFPLRFLGFSFCFKIPFHTHQIVNCARLPLGSGSVEG